VHCWSQRQHWGNDQRRHDLARASWTREYATEHWLDVPVSNPQISRNAKSALRDPRALPFVRDLLDIAVRRASARDIIVFTNDDVTFAQGLTATLLCVEHAAWASRHEFIRLPNLPSCLEILAGRKHCGADLFAMTPAWWCRHRAEFPDMIIGCEAWDLVLRKLMASTGGIELHAAIAHEEHGATWQGRRSDPSALHNRKLAGDWLAKRGLSWD